MPILRIKLSGIITLGCDFSEPIAKSLKASMKAQLHIIQKDEGIRCSSSENIFYMTRGKFPRVLKYLIALAHRSPGDSSFFTLWPKKKSCETFMKLFSVVWNFIFSIQKLWIYRDFRTFINIFIKLFSFTHNVNVFTLYIPRIGWRKFSSLLQLLEKQLVRNIYFKISIHPILR